MTICRRRDATLRHSERALYASPGRGGEAELGPCHGARGSAHALKMHTKVSHLGALECVCEVLACGKEYEYKARARRAPMRPPHHRQAYYLSEQARALSLPPPAHCSRSMDPDAGSCSSVKGRDKCAKVIFLTGHSEWVWGWGTGHDAFRNRNGGINREKERIVRRSRVWRGVGWVVAVEPVRTRMRVS